ncbi:hypothetical protein [Paraburkholderia heleia]|uniref:hypothetical protein n=1 Tax=Paraburkholderia heleia TaxID=634127 RepID=UPI002AB75605|nr:hypothetical protein [Paraburkholderia heleia]
MSKAGFHFPDAGRWTADSGHHGLAVTVSSSEHAVLVDSLTSEIARVPHHVVLSSEEFTRMLWHNTSGFQQLVDRLLTVVDRVTVIFYLRRQTDFIESNYIERLKSRFSLGFSTYAFARIDEDLAEFPLDYRRLVDVLDRVQNIDVDVRSYDGVRTSGVLDDFLSSIDWPAGHPIDEYRINESLPLVESLKNFWRAHTQRAMSGAEEQAIELIAMPLPARPRMDTRTRRHLIRHFDACNRELAARFALTPLIEAIPEELTFGAWTGLDDTSPPHQESMWTVTLDQLFSRTFIEIVQAVSERLGKTETAMLAAQALVLKQHEQLEKMQQALDRTKEAPRRRRLFWQR